MKNKLITQFEQKSFSKTFKGLPKFRSGDTVKVYYKIQEGAEKGKYRVQPFEGVVTRFRKGTADGSFTVRKISAGGVGVERVFPLMSPFIDKVEVKASGIVNRARLFYLRDLAGKAARIKSRYFGKKGINAELILPLQPTEDFVPEANLEETSADEAKKPE